MNSAFAQDAPTLESVAAAAANAQVSADTGYMLTCAAMVLLMTPGLAFFYGGFVRSRNVLNTMMMSFLLMGIVSVTWVLWGYSLAFAPGNPLIGGLEWLFLHNVGYETTDYMQTAGAGTVASYAPTIPHQTFMIYQAMFAIITPALISGAIVERINFRAYALFVLLWSTFIYSPMAHMVWGNGGLLGLYGGIGSLDFAGGTVVHILSAVSALVAAFVIGPRKTYPNQPAPPHNVTYILLGAGLLWFGWFGFNAGSALAAGSLATAAFVSTNTAAGAATLTWLILETVLRGKATAVGAATAAVVGLVAITPAAGFVDPIGAILIGSIGAVCCFYAVSLKAKLQFDDSLDVFPVHGVGGTVGALLTGIFATKTVNAAIEGHEGLLFGNFRQLFLQIAGVLIAYILAAVGTFVILKILDATVGLRVQEECEFQGLDINEHGEEGYGEEIGLGSRLEGDLGLSGPSAELR
ncbi:ammonium transporter [Microcoleus sp. FACHB-1515]|uniref:ammonium transporter n=1 Tax=Cyanophyceae TaxID=3028117 RepID=UPI0016893D09|nr:ammonium transporter [Microcoleus sp. FACHB-1515]MBD2089363.1 ammonium transporter [Microcoleus sp. FACHB-1515]